MERGSELEFANIIALFDQDRRVLSPAYYRFSNSPSVAHSVRQPWAIEFKTGVEIDPFGRSDARLPIFFATFGENPSRRVFARLPISVGALL